SEKKSKRSSQLIHWKSPNPEIAGGRINAGDKLLLGLGKRSCRRRWVWSEKIEQMGESIACSGE
ncbi:unnamed protein product, partial [Linum tenue]